MKYKMKVILPMLYLLAWILLPIFPTLLYPVVLFGMLPMLIFVPIFNAFFSNEGGDYTNLGIVLTILMWFLIGTVLDFFPAKLKIARARLRDWETRKGFQ